MTMFSIGKRRPSPIGIDIGTRSIKLLQLATDRTSVLDAARCDLPVREGADAEPNATARADEVARALRRAKEGRGFRGRDAVICLSNESLYVQNLRVPPAQPDELRKNVENEAATRLPFPLAEAELRFVEVGDVRQGDSQRRELILLACHRPALDRMIALAESAGFRPVAVDAEPLALLRGQMRPFRRTEDQQRRMMFVNVGASSTVVVASRGPQVMFVKYIDLGGKHFDQAVAEQLALPLPDAIAVRRHHGERRANQRDAELGRTINEAVRPAYERLVAELAMCLRYYSVTFRGQPLARIMLGGGEADETLLEWVAPRVDVPCELSNPLRPFDAPAALGRATQWDVAAGLALKEIA